MQKQTQNYLVAIDIAKDSLQVATCRDAFTLPNEPRGSARLLRHARKHSDPLVVFEASGGYERPLFDFLHAHQVPCVV